MALDKFIDYIALEKKYADNTVRAYKNDLQSFFGFLEATYQTSSFEQVNYAMIRNWIVVLVEQGLDNKSVNRKIASLKAYFKFLLKTGQLKENPLAKHKSLKISKKQQIPFSEKEMKQVLQLLEENNDFESIRNKAIVELFYTTGMRKSELIELKITDLNLDSKTVKVLGKRNKERIIPLLQSTAETLRKYIDERKIVAAKTKPEYVFVSKKGVKVSQTLVYRIINNYFSKASSKVKKSPHMLRHTFATHLLNEGAELNAVKELLGHASLASTQVYVHNSIAELKKAYIKAHPRNNN